MAARTLPTLPTWSAGSRVLASSLQAITTWGNFWSDAPTFRMYQTIAQTLTTGVDAQITCDTNQWDTDSGRGSSTPWSYTIPSWGSGLRWTFHYMVGYSNGATGSRISYIKKNGTALIGARSQEQASTDLTFVMGSCSTTCSSGDVISLWGFQDNGGNLNTNVAVDQSMFEGWLRGLGNP